MLEFEHWSTVTRTLHIICPVKNLQSLYFVLSVSADTLCNRSRGYPTYDHGMTASCAHTVVLAFCLKMYAGSWPATTMIVLDSFPFTLETSIALVHKCWMFMLMLSLQAICSLQHRTLQHCAVQRQHWTFHVLAMVQTNP